MHMKIKFFNIDYFRQIIEEPHYIRLCASKIKREDCSNNTVLVIAPCLVGEFVAMFPALFDFYQRSNKKIDLVVTSPMQPLAKRMIGVRNVFIAKSVSGRINERATKDTPVSESYEEVIIVRASKDVLRNIVPNIKASRVTEVTKLLTKYALGDIFKNLLLRQRPTQWRDISFSFFGGKPRNIPFKDIFNFTEDEYENIDSIAQMDPKNKKIIIHTKASWPTVDWDRDKWVDLLQKIRTTGDFDFIFIGQEKEAEDYAYIRSQLDFPIFSLISKQNLAELSLVMNAADYFIGIDSGPGNLAHLVGLRSMIIYGPGPHMYMSGDPKDVIIDRSNGRGLYQKFFLKKNSFIKKISVDEVYRSFCTMIQG